MVAMRAAFWNIWVLALPIIFSFQANALVSMPQQMSELGMARRQDVVCVTGKIQEQLVNQVRYFIRVEQDYDRLQDQTIAVFEIGVTFVKEMRTLSEVVPNALTLSEWGEEKFKSACAQYVSQTRTGVTVSATMEKSFAGRRQFSNFEALATADGLEKFKTAVQALEQRKGEHIHTVLNPSFSYKNESGLFQTNMEPIILMSGAIDVKPLESVAKEWNLSFPLVVDQAADADGRFEYSTTPNP